MLDTQQTYSLHSVTFFYNMASLVQRATSPVSLGVREVNVNGDEVVPRHLARMGCADLYVARFLAR